MRSQPIPASSSRTILFRLAVLMYCCLHGSAPDYLASDSSASPTSMHVNDCTLSSMSAIVAPRTLRATIGDRAFLAAAASVWNSMMESVRPSPSLTVFHSRLKTGFFARFYSCSLSSTLHWLLHDSSVTVTCPCSLRTRLYAMIRAFSSSSSLSSTVYVANKNTKFSTFIIGKSSWCSTRRSTPQF